MRAELGIYGSKHMHTPNFDKFGASSTVFERGYIAVSASATLEPRLSAQRVCSYFANEVYL